MVRSSCPFLLALHRWDSFSVHVLMCSSFTAFSGGCETIHISDIKARLNRSGFQQQKCNHKQPGITEEKIFPFTFCVNIPVIILLHLCNFGKQLASQMPFNFTINCCGMWIASPISDTLPNLAAFVRGLSNALQHRDRA